MSDFGKLPHPARSVRSVLMGLASMAASLGAIAYLLTSDVASAEDQPVPQAQAAQVEQPAQAQAPAAQKAKAKVKARKKRIDLGRFEGY